jgi:hypothetical protein
MKYTGRTHNFTKAFRMPIALILSISLLLMPVNMQVAQAAGVTKISANSFKGQYDIDTIHIGSEVTEISSSAFKGLMKLRSITVSEANPFYASYSNCLYNKELTELLCFPAALTGAYIPQSVVSIREYALTGVADTIKEQVRSVVKAQASENLTEDQVPGAHFIHTENGLKWKNADGSITEPDTELKQLTAQVVASCTTGNMNQSTQLQQCFDYIASTCVYERKLDVPVGDWTGTYAKEILATGKGNCYNYAAAFAYIARGLGYDARICTGTVESSLGGRTPHAWTEVKLGETWYIYDTEMQAAKGKGYYKQTYNSYPAGPLEKSATYTVSY